MVMQLLLYLLEEGEANRAKITDELTHDSSLTNRCISRLKSLKLVIEEIKPSEKKPWQSIFTYHLTHKGNEIALLLSEIQQKI